MAHNPSITPALIPVTGICVDCDMSRALTQTGQCAKCGSHSVIKQGAIKALRDKLKALEKEKRRAERAVRRGHVRRG